jgi:hypothetical protein
MTMHPRAAHLKLSMHTSRQKTKKPNTKHFVLGLFGRRDWTRTNDPHHVKVVL